jgi:histidyl-tRNA synthetase
LERHLNSLEIPYTVNSLIVRGLDYYTRTIFEVISSDLGAQNAVCGGGRYDNLIEELGGPDMPAIGFAIGEERLVSLLLEGGRQRSRPPLDLFVVAVDARAESEAFLWLDRARRLGLRAETDLRGGSLKSQLRRAHKLSARRVLILGERELHQRRALLKAMDSGEQEEVPLDRLEAQMAEWVQGLREEK